MTLTVEDVPLKLLLINNLLHRDKISKISLDFIKVTFHKNNVADFTILITFKASDKKTGENEIKCEKKCY